MNNYYGENWAETPMKKNVTVAAVNSFLKTVFLIMGAGLAITGVTSYLFANRLMNDPQLLMTVFGTGFRYVIMFAPLAAVLVLSFAINRINYLTAAILFGLVSFLYGISFSAIFLIYTQGSIASAFFTASAVFFAMAIVGITTKTDLTQMGSYLMIALIGVIIASLVNLFIGSSMLQTGIAALSVIIFTGLTAYDVQKLQQIGFNVNVQDENVQKHAILGALTLYMDFINLFLALLQLMGSRRD